MLGLFRFIPAPKLGKPPDKAGGVGPQGPFVVTAVLLITGMVVLDNLEHGSPSLAGLNAAVIACSALILGGVFAKGIREAVKGRQRLDSIPDLPNPEDELRKTQQMRTRAGELRAEPPPFRPNPELISHFRGKQEPLPPPPPPAPSVRTIRQLREDKAEDERLLRVAAILIVSCPLCGAAEASLCEPVEGLEWYQLDKKRGLYAHSLRIIKAVSLGTAKLEDVSAQFNDRIPEPIIGALL